MKDSLVAGVSSTTHVEVDRERTIDFMGDACRVYATPRMIADIEMACRNLLLEHLDDGEDSVGTRVEVDHLAPTLIGMSAEITVTVSAVDGRLVTFDVAGSDAVEPIARGLHKRFVVDVAKTAARLQGKAAKAGS